MKSCSFYWFDQVHNCSEATGVLVCDYVLLFLQLKSWPQHGWLSSWTQDFTAASAACSHRQLLPSNCWKSARFNISVIFHPWKQVYRKFIVFSAITASTFHLLGLLLELPPSSNTCFFWSSKATRAVYSRHVRAAVSRDTWYILSLRLCHSSNCRWARSRWCNATASGGKWLLGAQWGNIVYVFMLH